MLEDVSMMKMMYSLSSGMPPMSAVRGPCEHRGLADRGQHHQQDHGAETAADRVQEREGEDFEAAAPAHYGQSFEGMSRVPSVTCERCQKRCAACRSPSMGSSTQSIGTCPGSCGTASSKRRIRSAEFT